MNETEVGLIYIFKGQHASMTSSQYLGSRLLYKIENSVLVFLTVFEHSNIIDESRRKVLAVLFK